MSGLHKKLFDIIVLLFCRMHSSAFLLCNSSIFISFYLRPVLAFGCCRCLRLSVCPSVRPCGNHLLVRAITRHPIKLGSPNLDHRCKRPWLRSLLFWGVIDLHLQGKIKLQSPKLPHFELLGMITHHLFKLGSPNLGQRCKIPGLRLLSTLGLIGNDLQFHFQFWNLFFSDVNDDLCQIWKECKKNCRVFFKVKAEKLEKFAKNLNFRFLL